MTMYVTAFNGMLGDWLWQVLNQKNQKMQVWSIPSGPNEAIEEKSGTSTQYLLTPARGRRADGAEKEVEEVEKEKAQAQVEKRKEERDISDKI